MAAVDLGTNGEVMVTDGKRTVVASTAAGPAFEGVYISFGTRAVDGAIVKVRVNGNDGSLALTTIGDRPPVGLAGSGLLDLVCELRRAGLIERSGRLAREHAVFDRRMDRDQQGVPRFLIADEGVDLRGAETLEDAAGTSSCLTQHDIRELQEGKGAIHAATEGLMARLGLPPGDLTRMVLTSSFGSRLNVEAVINLGMIPPVARDVVEPSANRAGFGAALMLDGDEFARSERIVLAAEQIDLDLDAEFNRRYIEAMELPGKGQG